ncbi:hypothetical protein ACIGFK_21320 [Streptomyces sp. NPDC085524]|uniref:hypothetical protein n=1 Tax=Streptomyces sp. NPDC085524 TaxID=3365728 RepID=UPI0037D62392
MATKADRTLMQGFTCTEPARRNPRNGRSLPHHKEWEFEVQKWFRSGDAMADANGDAVHDGRLLLGLVGGGLAACASHSRLNHPGVETPLRKLLAFPGPIRNFKAFGIDCKHRGQGGAIADDAMEYVLADMFARERYAPTLVIARVDRRNAASEAFLGRHEFALIDDLPEPDEYRNWFTVLEAE